ncbi:MAG TPA: hypothetical protein VNJ02_20590 [Vicinamibacterales bacterium]|nr:hypothetical protein [Vicinamibacterales bacterium]
MADDLNGDLERRSFRDADTGIDAEVREEDMEPHAGLRYIAWLFKVLAILLVLVLIAELVIGLRSGSPVAITTLMVEATRLVVFAAFLWAAGDMALMFIESNHDLRATRILVSRLTVIAAEREAANAQHRPSDYPPTPDRPA